MQEKSDNKYTVLYKEPFSPPEVITAISEILQIPEPAPERKIS